MLHRFISTNEEVPFQKIKIDETYNHSIGNPNVQNNKLNDLLNRIKNSLTCGRHDNNSQTSFS